MRKYFNKSPNIKFYENMLLLLLMMILLLLLMIMMMMMLYGLVRLRPFVYVSDCEADPSHIVSRVEVKDKYN